MTKAKVYDSNIGEKANTSLAQRLQTLITNTQELAKYLGCSIQAVNQYKQGTAYPKVENLIKIADFYDISVDYLFGITEAPNRDTTVQAVCEYTGLSERSIQRLNSLKNQDDKEAVQVIDMLLDDEQEPLLENGRVSRSLINLIHFFVEYSGHEMPTKKVDVHGNITDYSQSRFVRSDAILLDDSIIENAILEELKHKLKARKGAGTNGEH